jgi:hypothetical protein
MPLSVVNDVILSPFMVSDPDDLPLRPFRLTLTPRPSLFSFSAFSLLLTEDGLSAFLLSQGSVYNHKSKIFTYQ